MGGGLQWPINEWGGVSCSQLTTGQGGPSCARGGKTISARGENAGEKSAGSAQQHKVLAAPAPFLCAAAVSCCVSPGDFPSTPRSTCTPG